MSLCYLQVEELYCCHHPVLMWMFWWVQTAPANPFRFRLRANKNNRSPWPCVCFTKWASGDPFYVRFWVRFWMGHQTLLLFIYFFWCVFQCFCESSNSSQDSYGMLDEAEDHIPSNLYLAWVYCTFKQHTHFRKMYSILWTACILNTSRIWKSHLFNAPKSQFNILSFVLL